MPNSLTYKPFGNRAILIEWEATVSEKILQDIVAFKHKIEAVKGEEVVDCIMGYHSLTLCYANEISDFASEQKELGTLYKTKTENNRTTNFLWEIPVCYDLEFGIDLKALSAQLNLSVTEIVTMHSETIYTVYFIGFLPGFLYLGGLNKQLHIARRATPRLHVEKGSVAIGGSQTGIYPSDSAGGWHILGKTPISFFEVGQDIPCFASPGDRIKFVPVSKATYKTLALEVEVGAYELSKQKLHD